MRQPNYRRGICCANCIHYSPVADCCLKHGGKIDFVGMCDDFEINSDLEDE